MWRALRSFFSIPTFAAALSVLWVVGFSSTVSPWPPQVLSARLRVLVNHWPESCSEFVLGGVPLERVSLDLGFRHTAWRDLTEFGIDLDGDAFANQLHNSVLKMRALVAQDLGATLREKLLATTEISSLLEPDAMDRLYRRYRVVNAAVTGIDPSYTRTWLFMLIALPSALLALALAVRSRAPAASWR